VAVIPRDLKRTYYGELALAPSRELGKIPATRSWQDAAATWMAYSTAWTGLIDLARLSAGQTVLITAASSSIGLAAIQIACSVGATPIALTRTSAKAAALLEARQRRAKNRATTALYVSVEDPDLGSFAVPREWTDWAAPKEELVAARRSI
jgi:NADPH:quinone reductase-like Zn-dependent oxidoreductase